MDKVCKNKIMSGIKTSSKINNLKIKSVFKQR